MQLNEILPSLYKGHIAAHMQNDRKKLDNSAILRTLRAATGLDQKQAAMLAGLNLRTMPNAEAGKAGRATFDKLRAVYASKGVRLLYVPGLYGEAVPVIAFDSDIAPDIDTKA